MRQEVCDEFVNLDRTTSRSGSPYQPTSIQNLIYWWQNSFQDRYQEFAPNYMDGEKRTDLIDIAAISRDIDVAMFVPQRDELCPFLPLIELKADFIQWYDDAGHTLFNELNNYEFLGDLIGQLQVPKKAQVIHEEL